jgi:translation initiation factor 1
MNSKKNREGIVYSTASDFEYDFNTEEEPETLPNKMQDLRIQLDKKQRGGKQVTLITGYIGKTSDLEVLGKLLKSKCGVGGNVKDREILIQGDHREKIMKILLDLGYKVKRIGG